MAARLHGVLGQPPGLAPGRQRLPRDAPRDEADPAPGNGAGCSRSSVTVPRIALTPPDGGANDAINYRAWCQRLISCSAAGLGREQRADGPGIAGIDHQGGGEVASREAVENPEPAGGLEEVGGPAR